ERGAHGDEGGEHRRADTARPSIRRGTGNGNHGVPPCGSAGEPQFSRSLRATPGARPCRDEPMRLAHHPWLRTSRRSRRVCRRWPLTVATRRLRVALSGLAKFASAEAVDAVPSCPLELTRTGSAGPGIEVPLTPARNARTWSASPTRIVPDSPALPGFAISTLSEP